MAALTQRYSPDTEYEEKIHPTSRVDTNLQYKQVQPAFGGEFQPGAHQNVAAQKKIANPAPLGLGAFALTTFVLSCINLAANDVTAPNLVVALAYGYGGLVQLLAGMWEMAVGNTFGATALSSYGGFWISFGLVLTPGLDIVGSYTGSSTGTFNEVFALYLWAWFIFTFLLLLLTLRSTVMFFLLFLTLDMAFLFLALSKQLTNADTAAKMQIVGGSFGIAAAAFAWYNMFAGIIDDSNFFFKLPVIHFPWSVTAQKAKSARSQV